MTPLQCKMARTAIGWGVRDLAKESKVATATITRFESGKGVQSRTGESLQVTLEKHVEFIDEGRASDGGGPGVRLKGKV